MGSTDDKVRGTANEAGGKVKQAVGDLTGNEEMKAEGAGQEVKGEAQKAVGHAKEAVGNAVETVGSALKGSGS